VATALAGLDAHNVRMARVNITMPDELYNEAKGARLNISRVAQDAVRAELARLGKMTELDAYLAELETELGPPGDNERSEARAWTDELFGPARHSRPE
jgi:post-segregation antitoxin (ccd killing protein)